MGEPTGSLVRTAVYRWYDSDDTLLYVGMTNNVMNRSATHAGERPWWDRIAYCLVEWHPSRSAAVAAESKAIRTEGAEWNGKMVSGWHRDAVRAHRRDDIGRDVPITIKLGLMGELWTLDIVAQVLRMTRTDAARSLLCSALEQWRPALCGDCWTYGRCWHVHPDRFRPATIKKADPTTRED
jgi:hypothetical protein